jgi:hypothetical protein
MRDDLLFTLSLLFRYRLRWSTATHLQISVASGVCYNAIHFSTVMFSRTESHNDQIGRVTYSRVHLHDHEWL